MGWWGILQCRVTALLILFLFVCLFILFENLKKGGFYRVFLVASYQVKFVCVVQLSFTWTTLHTNCFMHMCAHSVQFSSVHLHCLVSNKNAHGMRQAVKDVHTYIYVNKFAHAYQHETNSTLKKKKKKRDWQTVHWVKWCSFSKWQDHGLGFKGGGGGTFY